MSRTLYLLLLFCILEPGGLAYSPLARWGQASVVLNDTLFVVGGKTDQFNAYSYTSAPNVNDILYLPLSSPFTTDSPPWVLANASTNANSTTGPAVAWSTASAFSTSQLLVFGGLLGPNSATVADSAYVLNTSSPDSPSWTSEPASWANNEPIRRMRHSSATIPAGVVYIFGGEATDGSNNVFSQHYVFGPNPPTFSLLPTQNSAPDLYGHASITLSDGRILVFGGYSQSHGGLVPFSSIWTIDTTQSVISWKVITTDTTSLPAPRLAFAATLIPNGHVLIHGGSDAIFQNNFADGWILDTTASPMTWTQITALSQLGAIRDHFAVSIGNQVIFGFGYANNGPAPSSLFIFDTDTGTFSTTFTSPTAIQTTATPSQSGSATTKSHSSSVITSSSSPSPSNGSSSHGGSPSHGSHKTAIALGTIFGFLGILIVGFGAAFYVRRKRAKYGSSVFMPLDLEDDDESDSRHANHGRILTVGMAEVDQAGPIRRVLSSLGFGSAVRGRVGRRDILADEDSRSLGDWYDERQTYGIAENSFSLRNIGARILSHEPSVVSRHSSPSRSFRRERSDPFSDGPGVVYGFEAGLSASLKSRHRLDLSHSSSKSGKSYRDPFVDPLIPDDSGPDFSPIDLYVQHAALDSAHPTVRHVQQSSFSLRTMLPLSQHIGQQLSPVLEKASESTLQLQSIATSGSSQTHSTDNVVTLSLPSSPKSQETSLTSVNPSLGSSTMNNSSLISASDPLLLQNSRGMKRSDSWWSMFSRTSLLERKPTDMSRVLFDIRDPTPAPKLLPIAEASSSSTPVPTLQVSEDDDQKTRTSEKEDSGLLYGALHGKSRTSLKTVDSEAIERMGTMNVAQRFKSRGSNSMSSIDALSIETLTPTPEMGNMLGIGHASSPTEEDLLLTSPIAEAAESHPPVSTPPISYTFRSPTNGLPTSPTSPGVAERVREFERQQSLDETSPLSKNSKQREERTKKRVEVNYGLVPRPSLFVANPDHRLPSDPR